MKAFRRLHLIAVAVFAIVLMPVEALAQATGRTPNWTHSCEGKARCTLYGCAGPDSTGRWQGIGAGNLLPTYCTSNRRGFADAEDECRRIEGSPRPGPGGAPYILCDVRERIANDQSEPVPAGTATGPDFRGARTGEERVQAILDFGSRLLDLYSEALASTPTPEHVSEAYADQARQSMQKATRENRAILSELAAELSAAAKAAEADALGSLAIAEQRCSTHPRTRREIAHCFQTLSSGSVKMAAECERKAVNLETPRPAGGNVTSRVSGGQANTFVACSDLHLNSARAANCVAIGILRPSSQFNPLFKACAERWGTT